MNERQLRIAWEAFMAGRKLPAALRPRCFAPGSARSSKRCLFFPACLVLLSHKAAIFRAAKIREQIHEGDSRLGTRWWIWIAWLWRGVARVLPLLSGV